MASITTVLFDLDGTLLPMDLEQFTNEYLTLLAKRIISLGYTPEQFKKGMWTGIGAMAKNDGSRTNEQAFFECMTAVCGESILSHTGVFEDFYKNDFNTCKKVCGYNELAKKAVREIKAKGFRVAVATSPYFPRIATESRLRWCGLEPSEFEHYSTFEDYNYCKPNPRYYEQFLKRIGCSAEECLMVGNDVEEDMIAEKLGMKVFLITDCLINKKQKDISVYQKGSFPELLRYIDTLNKE